MLKIRFWPALITCAATLIAIALGFWQRDRTHQKAALQKRLLQYQNAAPIPVTAAPLPLRDVAYHRVRARGRWMPEYTVYLDNRPYHDQPGFYVLMALALNHGSSYALVNRGWLPRHAAQRARILPYQTPAGEIEIKGIARPDAGRAFELGAGGSAPQLRIRQNLDIAAYQKETGLSLQPVVIWQTGNANDGLIRDWPPATAGIERNLGYMVQWWGIAVAIALCGLYGAYRAAR
ncbi:SURF1 family protein [Candidatus Glomeribacter gigasporarum BEG34]|uniref:SURF1-like protein n=1 Tax=Candidatus Glomeribacter gigasporarum BEG34 TaxID=1070319 RepID=G2JBX1_9BURK|nr:SURF1 family protein [Candidatus Glomeribacter gigasporarum]CCD30277.1 SURF1 family protein [Candidatus Glomeribacter gigasporarum BEG34]